MRGEKLNESNFIVGIFFDLSRAFDVINRRILCEKMNKYGLRGKIGRILKSYLTERQQIVKWRGKNSKKKESEFGVPQGSVLGPLLFLIFMNDIRGIINGNRLVGNEGIRERGDDVVGEMMTLYADDTSVLVFGKDFTTVIKRVEAIIRI